MDSLDGLKNFGASIPPGEDIEENGFVELNLSDEIGISAAKKLTIEIPKLIANQREFYDIKAISYFEPDYTYSEFINDIKLCNIAELPFSVDIVSD